jgi:hypothetical protein
MLAAERLAELTPGTTDNATIKAHTRPLFIVALLLEERQEYSSLSHRFDHCGYAASIVDFVEDPALCRTEFSSWLLYLGSNEPTSDAPQSVGNAYLLVPFILPHDLEGTTPSFDHFLLDLSYELTFWLVGHRTHFTIEKGTDARGVHRADPRTRVPGLPAKRPLPLDLKCPRLRRPRGPLPLQSRRRLPLPRPPHHRRLQLQVLRPRPWGRTC